LAQRLPTLHIGQECRARWMRQEGDLLVWPATT
jgi:hypothetical protein